jgi:flagellar L-ring protein precursor FlgH
MKALWYVILLVLIAGVAACTNTRKDLITEDELALPVEEQPEYVQSPGSLWTPGAKFVDMYSDPLARRVGDIIMVQIVESTAADNKVTTESKRDNTIDNNIENLLGLPLDKSSAFGYGITPTVKATSASDFKADGKTERGGNINAVISARVMRILPSGNMMIGGKKQTRVNDESQYILLTGTIRPEDISSRNTIQSNYIADLKLEYYGSGILGDQQSKGFINRVIDKIWPF